MSQPAPNVPPPPAHPGRRKRVLLVVVLALIALPLALWVAVHTYAVRLADQELREALAETDRLDPRWHLEELEAERKPVPDDRNAALVVLAASKWLPDGWQDRPFYTELKELPPPAQLRDEQTAALRAELEGLAPPLREARRLAELPHGRFPITWSPDFLGTRSLAQKPRSVVSLLELDARLRAQDGDADGALASGRAMLNAGRAVGDEPLLLSQLVRVAMRAVAVRSLERTLAQGEPSEEALAAAQQLLRDEADQPLLWLALRGERAGAHELFTNLETGKITFSQVGTDSVKALLAPAALKSSHAWLVRYLTEAVEAAKLPPEQQDEPLQRLEARLDEAPPYAGLLVPAVARLADSFRRSQAELRCAAVALATERYRRAHGRWPESLTDLTPAYFDRVPTDPFDGLPLRYRRLPDGLVVYAVGPDGADNQGTLARGKVPGAGDDVGFRVWDVPQRRQPAPPPPEEPSP
jgi:hypothetical protein